MRPAGRGWSCRACDSAGASRAGHEARRRCGERAAASRPGPVLVHAGAGLRPPGVRAAALGDGPGLAGGPGPSDDRFAQSFHQPFQVRHAFAECPDLAA